MSNVESKHTSNFTWNDFWAKEQPWNDPEVLNELRKQAVVMTYATLRGRKVPKQVTDAALFVLGKMVASQHTSEKGTQLTEKDLQEAKKKAGLLLAFKQEKTGS